MTRPSIKPPDQANGEKTDTMKDNVDVSQITAWVVIAIVAYQLASVIPGINAFSLQLSFRIRIRVVLGLYAISPEPVEIEQTPVADPPGQIQNPISVQVIEKGCLNNSRRAHGFLPANIQHHGRPFIRVLFEKIVLEAMQMQFVPEIAVYGVIFMVGHS